MTGAVYLEQGPIQEDRLPAGVPLHGSRRAARVDPMLALRAELIIRKLIQSSLWPPPGANRLLSVDDRDFIRGICPRHEPPVSRGDEEPAVAQATCRAPGRTPRAAARRPPGREGDGRGRRAVCAWSWATSGFACHFGYTVDLLGVRSVRGSHANTRDTTRSLGETTRSLLA